MTPLPYADIVLNGLITVVGDLIPGEGKGKGWHRRGHGILRGSPLSLFSAGWTLPKLTNARGTLDETLAEPFGGAWRPLVASRGTAVSLGNPPGAELLWGLSSVWRSFLSPY